jgi:hypothetical protein
MWKMLAAATLSLGLALTAAAPKPAAADGGDFVAGTIVGAATIGLLGAFAPYYYAPRPVYRAPIYVAPRPVYVAPRPIYVAPRPVYVAPRVAYRPVYRPVYRPAYRPAVRPYWRQRAYYR